MIDKRFDPKNGPPCKGCGFTNGRHRPFCEVFMEKMEKYDHLNKCDDCIVGITNWSCFGTDLNYMMEKSKHGDGVDDAKFNYCPICGNKIEESNDR